MLDLSVRLQNLKWTDDFNNIELDLALHPDVFNIFVDACNERLATCLRLDEIIPKVRWRPLPNQEIDGLWIRYYGDSSSGGIFTQGQGPEYATTANAIFQLPRTNQTIKVEHKSINALGTVVQFDHIFSIFDKLDEYPTPYNFRLKTNLFDLKQTTPVNTWPWLQSIAAYICFFFIKDETEDGLLDIDKLGERFQHYSWRSTFFDNCTKEDLTQIGLTPKFFGLSGLYDLPSTRYGKREHFVPKLFRRVYPRTIYKLSDVGEQGQVARLVPHYSQALDPDYKNIRFNYHKLYIYDTEAATVKFDGDGNPIFSNWRLLTDDEAKSIHDPDFLTGYGFAQRGDYFGGWILEDIKKALNLCKYGKPHEVTNLVFDYSSNQSATQQTNELSPAYDLEAIALKLDRVAEIGDTVIFLKRPDSRLKVGQYALTGGPNKIFQIFGEVIILENPVLERMMQSISFAGRRRTGILDYVSPLNRFLTIPIYYSGNLPTLGPNSGIYYPGFDLQSYSYYASGAPVKVGSFLTLWGLHHPTGYVDYKAFLTFFHKDFAKRLKYIHFFKSNNLTFTQTTIETVNIIDWLLAQGHTTVYPHYDLTTLKQLSYEQDAVYGVGLQNGTDWDKILLEFDFQYKGA